MKELTGLKVALVTDSMVAKGGSDRNINSLLKIFPKADIYTAIFNQEEYPELENEVYTTFLQRTFFRKFLKKHYNILTPWAFEMLNLTEYDLVISVSAGSAKGVITTMEQLHFCLLLTPPRTYWDKERSFRSSRLSFLINILTPFFGNFYRVWDYSAAQRIDYIIAISQFIQTKIRHRYRLNSDVVYPGIIDFWFRESSKILPNNIPKNFRSGYFLVVSRLYDYKRIDWAIKACREKEKKLIVVGDGPDSTYLKKIAKGSKDILFLGYVSEEDLRTIYRNSRALIFPGIEDFGLVPVEAMACGCPVIAYNYGGVTETVVKGKTGIFFSTLEELGKIVENFDESSFDKEEIKNRAKDFTEEKFLEGFSKIVLRKYEKFKNKET